ncbi:MAG: hypothetical protein IKW81_09660 [Pseudobutyrivibrio sp.]|nr:hypothetical protein [Pseudobutyrivibrio sp.]
MFFIYKNNLQMYRIKDEIVIKTINKTFKVKEDGQIFETIKALVEYLKQERLYEEIIQDVNFPKQDIDKALSILYKSHVILAGETKDDLCDAAIIQFENPIEIKKQMQETKIVARNLGHELEEHLKAAGLNIDKKEGDYEIEKISSLKDLKNGEVPTKKIITGEEGGVYYILCLKPGIYDFRKIKNRLLNDSNAEPTATQKKIYTEIIKNVTLHFIYEEDTKNNVVLVNNDLSVEKLSMNLLQNKKEIEIADIKVTSLNHEKPADDYKELDAFINNLSEVESFGSMNCEQFPIPKYEVVLLDGNGKEEKREYGVGEKCEEAMLRTFNNMINYEAKKDEYYVSGDKQEYYFNLLAKALFSVDAENVKEIGVFHDEYKTINCFIHEGLNILRIDISAGGKVTSYISLAEADFEKLAYIFIKAGLDVNEAKEHARFIQGKMVATLPKRELREVNEAILNYVSNMGYRLNEELHPYSKEIREFGFYLGKINVEAEKVNG